MDIRILLVKGELSTEVKDGLVWYSNGWVTHNAHIQIKELGEWVNIPVVEMEGE